MTKSMIFMALMLFLAAGLASAQLNYLYGRRCYSASQCQYGEYCSWDYKLSQGYCRNLNPVGSYCMYSNECQSGYCYLQRCTQSYGGYGSYGSFGYSSGGIYGSGSGYPNSGNSYPGYGNSYPGYGYGSYSNQNYPYNSYGNNYPNNNYGSNYPYNNYGSNYPNNNYGNNYPWKRSVEQKKND